MTLDTQIEAILFYKAEPVPVMKLCEILEKNEEEMKEAINTLEIKLENRGIMLLRQDDKVMLGTHREASQLIAKITKEELEGDLGKAGLETLSIVLYKGPINKKEIDYIRGVNSSFILRNLLIKGLIEKAEKKNDRNTYYQGTLSLLAYMGIQHIEELPEYKMNQEKLEQLKLKPEE